MTHELKVWKTFFDALWYGKKTFEIRKNDRNFRLGDYLILKEYDQRTGEYTDRYIRAYVNYIIDSRELTEFGMKPGYVIMCLTNMLTNYVNYGVVA